MVSRITGSPLSEPMFSVISNYFFFQNAWKLTFCILNITFFERAKIWNNRKWIWKGEKVGINQNIKNYMYRIFIVTVQRETRKWRNILLRLEIFSDFFRNLPTFLNRALVIKQKNESNCKDLNAYCYVCSQKKVFNKGVKNDKVLSDIRITTNHSLAAIYISIHI